ncbi:hypothetical protein [Micromonospora sp. NPDC049374]
MARTLQGRRAARSDPAARVTQRGEPYAATPVRASRVVTSPGGSA